jgi:hypothetical protein
MSWSVSVIGKPDNVCAELDRRSGVLSGQSKVEFDAALPHIKALVSENFSKSDSYQVPTIKLDASGSGMASSDSGEQIRRDCKVSIEPLWTQIV